MDRLQIKGFLTISVHVLKFNPEADVPPPIVGETGKFAFGKRSDQASLIVARGLSDTMTYYGVGW